MDYNCTVIKSAESQQLLYAICPGQNESGQSASHRTQVSFTKRTKSVIFCWTVAYHRLICYFHLLHQKFFPRQHYIPTYSSP